LETKEKYHNRGREVQHRDFVGFCRRRIARDYLILHGGLTALHAPAPVITLPESHKAKVAQIPLRVLGKAAALSDGRTADGCIEVMVSLE
jgi:hypothetical protein